MAATMTLPGLSLARDWSKIPTWQKGVGILTDVASFIPGIGMASALRRAGTPTLKALGKTIIAEVEAPITSVMHPVGSAKALWFPVESIARPKMLPITALEIREHIVKIPVGQIGKASNAKVARDKLFDAGVVELDGQKIALTKTALQDTVAGVGVHAGPDMRAYMNGAIVKQGREGGLYLAPNLHSRFTVASAFGDMPKGGIPGAIIITDPEILHRMRPTDKVYRNAVEMEKRLEPGEVLPRPSQMLFTRRPDGTRLALLVIGPKLSPAQITRLKVLGAKDVVRDIFAPAWKSTGKEMDELADLGRQTYDIENAIKKARKAGNRAEVRQLEAKLKRINSEGRRLARKAERQEGLGRPVRPAGLSYGEAFVERTFNDYAYGDPQGFAKVVRRMKPETREQVISSLEPRYREDIRQRVDRLPANVRVPHVYRPTLTTTRQVPDEPYRTEPFRTERPPREGRPPTERPPRGGEPPREFVPRVPPPGVPPPGEPGIPIVPSLSSTGKKEPQRYPLDSFTWKQGLWWVTVTPLYSGTKGQDMFWSREAPPGVRIVEGPQSAYKTVTKLGIRVPRQVFLDLGIMDVKITEHGKRIKFKRDVKQRTKLGYPEGLPAGVGSFKGR